MGGVVGYLCWGVRQTFVRKTNWLYMYLLYILVYLKLQLVERRSQRCSRFRIASMGTGGIADSLHLIGINERSRNCNDAILAALARVVRDMSALRIVG